MPPFSSTDDLFKKIEQIWDIYATDELTKYIKSNSNRIVDEHAKRWWHVENVVGT